MRESSCPNSRPYLLLIKIHTILVFDDENFDDIVEDQSEDFVGKKVKESTQNRTNLDYFIAELVRYGYSDRGGAALYNAALKSVQAILPSIEDI